MITPRLNAATLALLSICGLAAPDSFAQTKGSPFTAIGQYRFNTDIDGGGEVSSALFHLRAAVPLFRGDDQIIALSGGYGMAGYDFSAGAANSFSSLDPWDDVHLIKLSLPVRWGIGDRWSVFGAPGVRWHAEDGADFAEALTYGGIVAAGYRFGDKLTLGPGVGVYSQLEDSTSVFPVIYVDWKLNDVLSLSTGPSIGATQGPGLMLNWDVSDRLRLSLGARYEKHRFRLDEHSQSAPDGIGEDRTIPVFAAVTYLAGDHWRLSALGGVGFGNELRLENPRGRTIAERDSDPSPFVGLSASLEF